MSGTEEAINLSCQKCGHNEFFREITETYNVIFSTKGNQLIFSDVEDDDTHDLEYAPIRCSNCREPIDEKWYDIFTNDWTSIKPDY